MGDPNEPDDARATQGRLAHRLNNATAYTVTNLNLVLEELDTLPTSEPLLRIRQLVVEAAAGADRIGDLVRELRAVGYGSDQRLDDSSDDTWDEERRMRRVLVVDDEPFILASIRRALVKYDVTVAEGGQAAVKALSSGEAPFDLVLCDLVMPPFHGPQVYRWLVEHQPQLAERVIFMTAGAFTNELREFLQSVRNPVLQKPFDTKTLRWAIAQSLRSHPGPPQDGRTGRTP